MKNSELLVKFLKHKKIEYLQDEPLKNHTNFKIGGDAKFVCFPSSQREFIKLVKFVQNNDIDFYVLGAGTNVLCSDNVFDGVIIKLSKNLKKCKVKKNIVIADAGLNLFALNKILAKNSLKGLEFSYGIPGSVGGAVFMNAGANENAVGNYIKSVKVFDGKRVFSLKQSECDFSYRHSIIKQKGYVVLSAKFEFEKGIQAEIEQKQQEYYQKRISTQPYEMPCAGSIFKRLDNGKKPVSKMIDELGLKGKNQNDAEISTIHAGFIVNRAKATCKDVLFLIEYIRKEIKSNFNEDLELEIELVGDKNDFEGRLSHTYDL